MSIAEDRVQALVLPAETAWQCGTIGDVRLTDRES
jgi:hypothetical protein